MEKKYNCFVCDYHNDMLMYYNQHLKTKKHTNNMNKLITTPNKILNGNNLTCNFCDRTFIHQPNLSRHQKACNAKIKKEHEEHMQKLKNEYEAKIENIIQEHKIEISQLKYEHAEEKMEIYATENKNKQQVINAGGKIINNSLKYIKNTFYNAPAITEFDNYPSLITEEDYTMAEILIFHHRKKTLSSFLANKIISHYKKDDPENQSFWSTDCARLVYIIRENINENLMWVVDKGGEKIIAVVIKPILDFVRKEVNKHCATAADNMGKDFKRYDKYKEIVDNCLSLIDLIDKNILCRRIIRKIINSFHIDLIKNKQIKYHDSKNTVKPYLNGEEYSFDSLSSSDNSNNSNNFSDSSNDF